MKVVHLTAGAGPMYCGSCLQGNTLAAALRAAEIDLLLVPLYTPLRTDEHNVSADHLAFGGINVYLQERSRLFRHTPWFVDRLWDRPAVIHWAMRRGTRTRPEHLGALTLAMLRGRDGPLAKELEKLLRWLSDDVRPELIHLSNVMLSGLAGPLRQRLGVRVVSTLSGEDTFLDNLPASYAEAARTELRRQVAQLDALVAMSAYYADFMADYLAFPRDKIRLIPPGLNLPGYAPREKRGRNYFSPENSSDPFFTIGYCSRICPEKGLAQLAEAFAALCRDRTLPPLRLRAAGYLDPADRPYLDEIRRRLHAAGCEDRFEYTGEPDRAGKIAFLQSLDVFSVPSTFRESKGIAVVEASACGVPAVLPDHGALGEMVARSGGGLLYPPGDVPQLTAALRRMIVEPELAAACGRRAHEAALAHNDVQLTAARTIELYEELITGDRS
jgi:glycosyltransferase involved in cell wall biosynthesis